MTAASLRATCVIPVTGDGRFLEEAVDSVLGQTRPAAEVIVVDDGSTDGARQVADSRGGRVRCVSHEGGSTAAARNRGASLARGHVITFLDAGEIWDPSKLERQLVLFEERPQLGLCWGAARKLRADDLYDLDDRDRRAEALRTGRPVAGFATGTLAVRRSIFRQLGGFDEDRSHGASLEFHLRATQFGAETVHLDDVLLYRPLRPEGGSRESTSRTIFPKFRSSSM